MPPRHREPPRGGRVLPESEHQGVATEGSDAKHHQLRSMLKVGVIGFGGGSALIPVMERELVGRQGGLSEPTFVKDTVIANITPGTLPVKIAVLAGFQVGGAGKALASALLVALPGTAITVGLIASFAALGPGAISIVEQASLGVTAFIMFLLGHYVVKVLRPRGYWRPSYVLIALLSFLATGGGAAAALWLEVTGVRAEVTVPHLSALGLIIVALVIILGVSVVQTLRGRHQVRTEGASTHAPAARALLIAIAACVGLVVAGFAVAAMSGRPGSTAEFLGLVTFSTVSSFGGGEAYVGVADGFFVQAGWVDAELYYGQIVPVANALPGPILVKIAAGVGYGVGLSSAGPLAGGLLAVAVFLATVGICCAIALAVLAGYDGARDSRVVRNIASYILPVICGLLATTAVSMLHASAGIAEKAHVPPLVTVLASIALAVVVALVHRVVRVPDVLLILTCAGLSLLLLRLALMT